MIKIIGERIKGINTVYSVTRLKIFQSKRFLVDKRTVVGGKNFLAMEREDWSHLNFLISDVLRFQRNGLFHGNQAKNLQFVLKEKKRKCYK